MRKNSKVSFFVVDDVLTKVLRGLDSNRNERDRNETNIEDGVRDRMFRFI